MTKRAVLFIAEGTEEIEALAPFDILNVEAGPLNPQKL